MIRFLICLCLSCVVLHAQWDPPYENLKVLPEDITKQDLRNIMRQWSTDLGVRCTHCHQSDSGKFEDIDFASDEREAKKTARAMYKMTVEINAGFFEPHNKKIACYTCHHGTSEPYRLSDLLTAGYEKGGVSAVEKIYREKRKQYYGAGAYNFKPWAALNVLAAEMLPNENWADMKAVHTLNLEFNPDYDGSHFFLGAYHIDIDPNDELARKHMTAAMKGNAFWTPRKTARLAKKWAHQEKAAEAEKLLRLMVSIAPGNADAHANLGFYLKIGGRLDEAKQLFQKALALQPDHKQAKESLAGME